MPALDRDGEFEAVVLRRYPERSYGGALMIHLSYLILRWFDPESRTMTDLKGHALEISDSVCVVTKAGVRMEKTIQRLKEAIGWDGTMAHFKAAVDDWPFAEVRITVATEDRNGRVERRVKWVNPMTRPVADTPEAIDALDAEFGAILSGTAPAAPTELPPLHSLSLPSANDPPTAKAPW